jgi:hypothetical protein
MSAMAPWRKMGPPISDEPGYNRTACPLARSWGNIDLSTGYSSSK